MKFGKIFLLAAAFVAVTPFAMADTITITGAESGNGITLTGFTFGNQVFSGPHINQATGAVSADTGYLATQYGTTASVFYLPVIGSTPSFKYTTVNVSGPMEFMEIVKGGNTLDLWLSSLTATVGTVSTAGSFTATGYITDTNITGNIPVTFLLTNTAVGTGPKNWSAVLTTNAPLVPPAPPIAAAPEPSSLILLGSGMVSAAGMMIRKRRLA